MNTNLNGFSELSAKDLDSVSGGKEIITIPVSLVQALVGGKSFVETVKEHAVGTLKGLTPRPPK